MRLVELEPRWFAEQGRHGQGLSFWCPCCVGKPCAVRLGVAFAPTLDGGPPINLGSKTLFPALWPKEGERPVTTVPPGIHWQRTGEGFDSLTLSPSVDASAAGHWHGFVANGEVR